MPQIIYLAGIDQKDLAAIVHLLADRGYRIGVMSREGTATKIFGDDLNRYTASGASCVSIFANHGTVAMFPTDTEQKHLRRLFAGCHLILSDYDVPGCSDIIEAAVSDNALAYAEDTRLRAVIGNCFQASGITCFAHNQFEDLCTFIENRYLKPQLSAAILAGGKSQRLGTNKALVMVNGSALIEHVIQTAKQFTDTVRIIANDPEPYRHFNIPIAADIMPGGGPLSGIHTALSLSSTDYVLVLSCDMPLLTAKDIRPLISAYPGFDITLYKHQKFEPLCAVYRRTCIGALEDLIKHGEYRIIDLFPTLSVKVIRTDDPTPFTSINTWEDYKKIIGGKGLKSYGVEGKV